MNASKESTGEFVVTCRDGAELLEFTEKTFDEVSFAIKCEIGFPGFDPIRLGRDDGGDSPVVEDPD